MTLNPAPDYEVFMDGFHPGSLNRTKNEHIRFGGKGVNVSTVLAGSLPAGLPGDVYQRILTRAEGRTLLAAFTGTARRRFIFPHSPVFYVFLSREVVRLLPDPNHIKRKDVFV